MDEINVSGQDLVQWYEGEISTLRQRVRDAELSVTLAMRKNNELEEKIAELTKPEGEKKDA